MKFASNITDQEALDMLSRLNQARVKNGKLTKLQTKAHGVAITAVRLRGLRRLTFDDFAPQIELTIGAAC